MADPYDDISSPVSTSASPAPANSAQADPYAQINNDSTLSPATKQQLIEALKADPTAVGNTDAHGRLIVDIEGKPPQTPDPYDTVSSSADAALPTKEASVEDQVKSGLGSGTRDVLGGAGQLLNFIQSPVSAIWNGLGGHAANYEELADKLADHIGLPQSQNNVGSAFRRGVVSGLLTAGAATPLAGAEGATGIIARTMAKTPIADALSTGTSSASREAAKESGAGPVGQFAASLVGGGAGALATVGAPALARNLTQRTTPSELLAAFQRQNSANVAQGGAQLQPMAANVGGFGSKMMTAGAKATLGGLPLSAAAERMMAGAAAMRSRIASSMGRVTDDVGAGQAAIHGANTMLDTTAARGGKLYDAIPVAGNKESVLSNTKDALADLNAGLSSNEELSSLISDKRLQGYQKAIEGTSSEVPTGLLDANGNAITRTVQKGGKLSWQDLKSFRSYIGELAGRPTLQSDSSKEALQRLYAGLSQDMRATAAGDSPKALQAFERANTYWRARQSRIDGTLSMILGKDGRGTPEAAFAQIQRWSKEGGNFAAVGRALRSLSPDEANQVRASMFARLGNAPIRGHGEEAAFSPNYFLKHWTSIDPRAKAVLFPGEKYRQNLSDIASISKAMVASEAFTNTSRTALAAHIGGNLLGAGALAIISHPLAVGAEAAGYGAGHLLAIPQFAAWLASAAKKPNGPAALAHIGRLTAIASAEPAIANEVLNLQRRLASTFTDAPLKAAAQEPDTENRQ